MKVHNKRAMTAPPGAVYIGRGSPWGNPFRIGVDGTREEVIAKFEAETLPMLDLTPLRGKDLVCFCAPLACHGDILLREANKTSGSFKCDKCKKTFLKGWYDEDAEAEYAEMWGEHLGEERGVLCDNCQRLFLAWLKENKKDIDH